MTSRPTTAASTSTPAPPEIRIARLGGARAWLDPRRYIARSDLVEIALADRVAAARYVEATRMVCVRPRTAMRKAADVAAMAVSELLLGEEFDVFELVADRAFGRSVADRYVGWVGAEALAPADHRHGPIIGVTAPLAPLFAAPDIKAPVLAELPFGARLAGTRGEHFLAVAGGGFVHNRHVAPLSDADPLAIARRFTGAPYLWGGRTPAGVDCSGLVQAAFHACGIAAPRDSDQQRDALGAPVDFNERRAGDLVFFPGHVGILASRDRLFHANAHWMATVEEPLADVIARLHAAGVANPVSGVRRML